MNQLLKLIRECALQFGDFTLKSGRKSNFFLDMSQITMNWLGLHMIQNAIYDKVAHLDWTAVGGPATGAIPIAIGVAQWGCGINGFYVKADGSIHGSLRRGTSVLIVEDVITTGSSVIVAIEAVKKHDCTIVAISCIVDRDEGFQPNGVPYYPLFKIGEILKTTHGII